MSNRISGANNSDLAPSSASCRACCTTERELAGELFSGRAQATTQLAPHAARSDHSIPASADGLLTQLLQGSYTRRGQVEGLSGAFLEQLPQTSNLGSRHTLHYGRTRPVLYGVIIPDSAKRLLSVTFVQVHIKALCSDLVRIDLRKT